MLGDIIFLFILCTNWRIKIGKFEIDGYFSLLQIMKLNLVIKLQKRKILKIEITWIRHIYKTSLTANNKNIIETQLLKNLPSVFFRTGCHKVAVMECIDEKQTEILNPVRVSLLPSPLKWNRMIQILYRNDAE